MGPMNSHLTRPTEEKGHDLEVYTRKKNGSGILKEGLEQKNWKGTGRKNRVSEVRNRVSMIMNGACSALLQMGATRAGRPNKQLSRVFVVRQISLGRSLEPVE